MTKQRSLDNFIRNWDQQYKAAQSEIRILNPFLAGMLNKNRQGYFAKTFWHARGHFGDFLWLLASHAPDFESKKIILSNIEDELGANDPANDAHEQLYIRFANAVGAEVRRSWVDDKYYLPEIRRYNKGHLDFLLNHNWNTSMAAFSAFELLDNHDYDALDKVAKSFGLDEKERQYFIVHKDSDHFGEVSQGLEQRWQNDHHQVLVAFQFIGSHQLKMWKDLSEAVFNYSG